MMALAIGLAGAAAAQPRPERISHFSGKPVPRFAALRYTAVNGRSGPSLDHPILWRYEREGLPMLVVKETRNWVRVRDPDGDEVWVQARMLSGAPTAMARSAATLRRSPDPDARALARLDAGVIVELLDARPGWRKIEAAGRRGWVEQIHLWGADAAEAGL